MSLKSDIPILGRKKGMAVLNLTMDGVADLLIDLMRGPRDIQKFVTVDFPVPMDATIVQYEITEEGSFRIFLESVNWPVSDTPLLLEPSIELIFMRQQNLAHA